MKKLPAERENPRLMREMFNEVAPRYDFITRAFSYGMDRHWKRAGVDWAALPENPVVLDLAAGTGDFSILVAKHRPGARTIAVDLTERMLVENKLREYERAIEGSEDMIAVVDREYRYLIANRKFLKMRNMAREQVVGR